VRRRRLRGTGDCTAVATAGSTTGATVDDDMVEGEYQVKLKLIRGELNVVMKFISSWRASEARGIIQIVNAL
jgi:hypothetical protein